MGVAELRRVGHAPCVSDKAPSGPASSATPPTLACPVCGTPVDPRKTTQAVTRPTEIVMFCSPGCLRQYLAEERETPSGG